MGEGKTCRGRRRGNIDRKQRWGVQSIRAGWRKSHLEVGSPDLARSQRPESLLSARSRGTCAGRDVEPAFSRIDETTLPRYRAAPAETRSPKTVGPNPDDHAVRRNSSDRWACGCRADHRARS